METGSMNIPIKVSFVIPAYNEEDYIGRCLDAVFQNINGRKDIEVIVVDNNSTDRTAEVAARYKGVRLLHEMRPGANAARRRGFDEAKGDLVALPDADTAPPQGWLSDAEAEFAKDTKLVCVSGPFIYYDLPKRIRFMARIFYVSGYLLYLVGRMLFRTTTIIQGGNYVARRDAVEKANGLDPSITFYGDDTDLALKLNKVGKLKFSLKMKTLASGRRLAEEGAWMMGLRYALNYFWMVVARRPWTTSSVPVRFKNGETVYSPDRRLREAVIATLFFAVCVAVLAAIAYLIYHLFLTK